MINVREILDEIVSLMERQVLARENRACETEKYRQRAERIDELLSVLIQRDDTGK